MFVILLALASGCSLNEPPQAAPLKQTPQVSTQNEVTPSNEVAATAVTYQPAPPPPSVVKSLLQTKGCVGCDLGGADLQGANLQGQT